MKALKPEGLPLPVKALPIVFSVLGLFGYVHDRLQGAEVLSAVALTLAAWYFESTSVQREHTTFSCGFVFYLSSVAAGQPLLGLLQCLGAVSVRLLVGRRHLSDLGTTALVCLAGGGVLHFVEGAGGREGIVSVALLGLQIILFHTQKPRPEVRLTPELVWEQKEIANLRMRLCLLAGLALFLSLSQLWVMLLVVPICAVTLASTENLTYRYHYKTTEKERVRAEGLKKQLKTTEADLAVATQKQDVLESLAEVFTGITDPREAFARLCEVTKEIVTYRSVVLVAFTEEGVFEPVEFDSPDSDVISRAALLRVSVPQLQKCWAADRPMVGQVEQVESRLVEAEQQLVVLPVKPLGVLYFGRELERFSKAEASRLWFIVRRAQPALLRSVKDERTRRELHSLARKSEQLVQQVTLSSKLLEGLPGLLNAVSRDQTLLAFRELLEATVPHAGGLVVAAERWSWGTPVDDESKLDEFLDYLADQSRAVCLMDLKTSRYSKMASWATSVLASPLTLDDGKTGWLILFTEAAEPLSREERDFVSTCAYLLGMIFHSHKLSADVAQSQQQIVQASKLSAIGQLAAGVAHELNSPLAAIALALEAAQLNPATSAPKLERAASACERARKIVSDLLDYSRQAGEERVLVEPEEIVSGAIDLVRSTRGRNRVKLRVDYRHEEGKVLGSLTEFQQILVNLILNALDASAEGREVVITTVERDSFLEFSVLDTGSGIAPENQDKVFDPFFTTKPAGQGTGLGLSVCKQLAERHSGRLTFETEVGAGSRFTLSLPARLRAY